ncbi:putative ribonuclease H-like domain-containing protein [Tanacetum coccineum]|uniref:Ribonuclease H-like domain-containing protein n=1 Tax=Tanacetum coccineum TaxID=301880 RepID=A0ABQ5GS81_9ASTR
MPTKIELTLEQSQQGVSNDVLPKFEGNGPKTSKSVSKDISNEADYNYHQRERVVSGNNYTRVNYNYSAKHAHLSAHRNMAPRADLMKTGLRPLNIVRLMLLRPQHVGFGDLPNLIVHLQKEDQGYVDSGCSRHMTRNMSYLSDFKEFDGGYVTFGGGAKGGKITGKGTLKTGKLDFEDVFLKVPRKNNMYSVDLKNIIPKESLTCLVAKATLDESMLWHRRLGHNKVLVVKPHNKTPYELFRGRTPALSFMRPFGCHVTILNTLDYLGKFDGKSDEGFFVGYSMNSDGPKWLFDIDVLTKSMNIMPVVVGTNSNDFVDGSLFDYSSKNTSNDEPQPSSDAGKKDDKGEIADQERLENSTQGVNTVGTSINTEPNMFSLGDNATLEAIHANFFSDETESGVQTRRMTKTTNEQGFISVVYEWKTHKDLHTSRIETIRLFLAYASFMGFMVYQMDVKSAFLYDRIEEKSWYGNLGQVFIQKMGFIRKEKVQTLFIKKQKGDILLVHVYVYGIIFGSTKKELCTEFEKLMHDKFQMSSMGELTFFLGLQVKQKEDGIFISQDKYVADILRKFSFTDVRTASTPMDTEKPLLKDSDGDDVDVHLYRSMIGSLMYLTSSRPDIMFAVCACARFQVTPKVSHLHAVKRIFRYLKGQPKLGLWYPRDSSFDLVAYSDSDYAGASLDRKSTTRGCQFLGCRLISWQCKKQTMVATSSTKAEYVVVASCCGQYYMYY